MNSYKVTKQVKRLMKKSTRTLSRLMVILAVVFVFLGIFISRGMFLPAFLLAGLYYLFTIQTDKEYEYVLEDGKLTIDVIKGKRRRKRVHELFLKDMEIVAPNWHEEVAQYRKDGGSIRLPKYDYTSYDDDIPYYTMIIMENKEKIKLLLDLDEEMLQTIKRIYPQKVYL